MTLKPGNFDLYKNADEIILSTFNYIQVVMSYIN